MVEETNRKTKKGFIKICEGEDKDKEIEILYFPTEYSIEKTNSFSEISIPGLESPYLEYLKGNASTISLEVFYDTYEEYDSQGRSVDVRKYTNQLSNLMNIDPEIHGPPRLLFIWGISSEEPFSCVLEKVTKKFTMFNSDGIPVRARLNITLKEKKFGLNDRERKLQSADRTKYYMVKQGDSLWSISYKEYRNPGLWRPIADINDINDPKKLESGTELIIPPLEKT
jgi:hypothetical protein